jgi:hypothetical protein
VKDEQAWRRGPHDVAPSLPPEPNTHITHTYTCTKHISTRPSPINPKQARGWGGQVKGLTAWEAAVGSSSKSSNGKEEGEELGPVARAFVMEAFQRTAMGDAG